MLNATDNAAQEDRDRSELSQRGGSAPAPALSGGLPRWCEFPAAALLLLLVAPLLALASVLIALTMGFPVLFRQQRMGRAGRPFTLYKLRTMRPSSGGPQVTAGDDNRMTWVGRWLRKSKVDELPELWNILKGDMSFVGPRPEVPGYVDLSNPLWVQVLQAKPGLTDPVTTRLRNEEDLLAEVPGSREEFYQNILQPYKLRGYVSYLRARSWSSDLAVLGKTGVAILFPGSVPPPRRDELFLPKT